ncbi:MAG: carboxylesterase family protein [Caulobacterales bacterium]
MKWTPALLAMLLLAACAAPSFITGILSPLSALRAPDGRPVVTTRQGPVQGVTQDAIASFQGIRYAAAPAGDMRWRAPQPAPAHREIAPADKPGAICMQTYDGQDAGIGPLPMSEDCLTLNIWTRDDVQTLQPVMVWIHGGAFATGSGTGRLYDGAALARRGVVVVTLNYRLGRLGFFAHPALTREAGSSATANFGLMDQIAALEWVRDNIAAFGGDPQNVTVFGQDAGGMSILRLMTIGEARGLFQKAIVQSGAGLEANVRLDTQSANGFSSAEDMGRAFAARMGVPGDDLVALRALPADRIVAEAYPALYQGGGPIIDGRLLRSDVAEQFRGGAAQNIPMIVGANSLEIPISDGEFDTQLQAYLNLPPAAQAALREPYADDAAFRQRVMSDVIFSAPARQTAIWRARSDAPVYLYRFGVVSQFARWKLTGGAPHNSDRQYVFGNLRASAWPTAQNDNDRSAEMMTYWVQFARTGDPNTQDLPNWPRYAQSSDVLMEFANNGPITHTTPDAAVLDRATEVRLAGR